MFAFVLTKELLNQQMKTVSGVPTAHYEYYLRTKNI